MNLQPPLWIQPGLCEEAGSLRCFMDTQTSGGSLQQRELLLDWGIMLLS